MSGHKWLRRWSCVTVAVFVLAGIVPGSAQESPIAPTEISSLTLEQIRQVLSVVVHRQICRLGDGDYQSVDTLGKAASAVAPAGISWRYPWGVALYGMLRVAEVLRDREVEGFVLEHNRIAARYYDYLQGMRQYFSDSSQLSDFYSRTSLNQLMKLGALDYCGAMGAQMLEGLLRHGVQATPEQRKLLETIADYIFNKQSRLSDGTFWRPEAMGGTVWIDDLYMSCPFLVRWYEWTGERKYLDDAAKQIINMARRVQDKDGLWYHGFFVGKNEPSPYRWGRGNGWAMVAAVEVLSVMPEDHPDRGRLLEILRRHIDGIRQYQAPSGMWRQVLDRPELWEETSCTAMFAYSIARAVNRGWIGRSNMEMAWKAFAGIRLHVTAVGEVNGTCQGTNIGMDLEYYINRRRPNDDMHGRGSVMLAGAEILSSAVEGR